LSQHEVGKLVGYRRSWQISRHERSKTAPPLLIALAYEALFRVPVSAIFTGFQATVAHAVEMNVAEFEKNLREASGKDRATGQTARKLQWLALRRSLT
jgi:DNA-binding XRE family transcriptional regulator